MGKRHNKNMGDMGEKNDGAGRFYLPCMTGGDTGYGFGSGKYTGEEKSV